MPTSTIGANSGDDYAGCDDTQIREVAATTNYETNTLIEAHKFGSGDHANILIAFPGISSLPAGATITDVSLFLRLSVGGSANTLSAYRGLRAWLDSEATWNVWTTGNSWTTAGGISSGNDRAASASGTGGLTGLSVGDWLELTGSGMVTDVQDWYDGASNYGWHIERSDGSNDATFQRFDSSEASDTQRPYLQVTYTLGPSVQPTLGSRLRPYAFGPGQAR